MVDIETSHSGSPMSSALSVYNGFWLKSLSEQCDALCQPHEIRLNHKYSLRFYAPHILSVQLRVAFCLFTHSFA